MAAPTACSSGAGGPSGPQIPKQTAGAITSHAIHVYIKQPDGSRRLADFGPATDVSIIDSRASIGPGAETRLRPPGRIRPMTADAGTTGTPVTAAPTIADPGTDVEATAWMLVERAALACTLSPSPEQNPTHSYNVSVPPWATINGGPAPWYIYTYGGEGPLHGPPATCADRLFLEQNLLCISDQLASIADAVGDVIWAPIGASSYPPSLAYQYGEGDAAAAETDFAMEWDIPPQSDDDRFIVRDLALHNLAMIPVLDSYTDILGQTCAQSFAQVASVPSGIDIFPKATGTPLSSTEQTNIVKVFGIGLAPTPWNVPNPANPIVPVFPPSSVPYVDANQNNNMPAIAKTALDIEAQILRAGGRLLHDLIRRDVYSDLAAAAQAVRAGPRSCFWEHCRLGPGRRWNRGEPVRDDLARSPRLARAMGDRKQSSHYD